MPGVSERKIIERRRKYTHDKKEREKKIEIVNEGLILISY